MEIHMKTGNKNNNPKKEKIISKPLFNLVFLFLIYCKYTIKSEIEWFAADLQILSKCLQHFVNGYLTKKVCQIRFFKNGTEIFIGMF